MERKEKICLNCNSLLHGRYCHVCGQENVEPKETLWHLANHVLQDITHFDGKFFGTVKYLLTKPGFLSQEYMKGRRARYLNPIRMYIFTSAIFFLIFFSITKTEKIVRLNGQIQTGKKEGISDWEARKAGLMKPLAHSGSDPDVDTADAAEEIKNLDQKISWVKKVYGDTTTRRFGEGELVLLMMGIRTDSLMRIRGVSADFTDTLKEAMAKEDISKNDSKRSAGSFLNPFHGLESRFSSPEQYDSDQVKLPPVQRDGWIKRLLTRRMIVVGNEFKKDNQGYWEHFKERFIHSFPQILFISLPFFALILKLAYFRRKQFYYTSHGIFAIHLYCATFLLLLIMLLTNYLQEIVMWKWLNIGIPLLDFALWIYILAYMYKAMRRFYGQGRFKTIIKYLIVNLFAVIIILFLLAIFILISAISV
jgi:hypothetical protein